MISLDERMSREEFDKLLMKRLERRETFMPVSILEDMKAGKGVWFSKADRDMRSLRWSDCIWIGKFGRL